nr:hypothetical protein [Kibdelosporangium sp. MJ126-NF4]
MTTVGQPTGSAPPGPSGRCRTSDGCRDYAPGWTSRKPS